MLLSDFEHTRSKSKSRLARLIWHGKLSVEDHVSRRVAYSVEVHVVSRVILFLWHHRLFFVFLIIIIIIDVVGCGGGLRNEGGRSERGRVGHVRRLCICVE